MSDPIETKDYSSPKTARAAKQRQDEKRSNILYALIAVAFVAVLVVCVIFNSNILKKNTTAAVINGEKYNAGEVSFYYHNVYNLFMNNYSYLVSYIGLDTSAPLGAQTISDDAATMLGIETGKTWRDYFMDQACNQIATVHEVLSIAKNSGYQFGDISEQKSAQMDAFSASAAASMMSVPDYLAANYGACMTQKIFETELENMLKYSDYLAHWQVEQRNSYTDAQLEEHYQNNKDTYDVVSAETIYITPEMPATTDANGNTIEPSDAETAAAKAAAEATAQEFLAAYKSGKSLSELADSSENATYVQNKESTYTGSVLSEWLFDSSRKNGDSTVLTGDTTCYVAVFHERSRLEDATVNVRHILVKTAEPNLAVTDEGYEAEKANLAVTAHGKAAEILNEWKAGPATEESFATLATERTEDPGSSKTGGLYEHVAPGEMVPTFNDWIFDASRKIGDTDIVDTTYGSHVMYFCGTDIEKWKYDVATDLMFEEFSTMINEFPEKAVIETKEAGLKLID